MACHYYNYSEATKAGAKMAKKLRRTVYVSYDPAGHMRGGKRVYTYCLLLRNSPHTVEVMHYYARPLDTIEAHRYYKRR